MRENDGRLVAENPNEWICSHYQRKDFTTDDEMFEHRGTCYVDSPRYWEMDPISDDEYLAMLRTNEIWLEGDLERTTKGHLRWLDAKGNRPQ